MPVDGDFLVARFPVIATIFVVTYPHLAYSDVVKVMINLIPRVSLSMTRERETLDTLGTRLGFDVRIN